mmetsp:Transcript_149902/g.417670  ORF Transcript_149902/g.417670 Transcript_149902/m.417670 type:complete len:213 (+) Transcript_149902:689-1327(+)
MNLAKHSLQRPSRPAWPPEQRSGARSCEPSHSARSSRTPSQRASSVTSPLARRLKGQRPGVRKGKRKVTKSPPLNRRASFTASVAARGSPASSPVTTRRLNFRHIWPAHHTPRNSQRHAARPSAQGKQQRQPERVEIVVPSSNPFSPTMTTILASRGRSGGPPKRMKFSSGSNVATRPSKSSEELLTRTACPRPPPQCTSTESLTVLSALRP